MMDINIPDTRFLIIKYMLRNVIFLLLTAILCICNADNYVLDTQPEGLQIYDYKSASFLEKILQYANTHGIEASCIALYRTSYEYDDNNTQALYDEIIAILDHCNNNRSDPACSDLLKEADIFFENIMRSSSIDYPDAQADNNFLTRKKYPSKKFNTLIAERLRVCGNTVVNNLTVDGDLIAYGCINFPEVNPGTGYMASFDVVTGQLVKASSSKKYKDNIKAIDDALIESLYKLRPVEFFFKNAPTSKAFGLVAEEVDAVCSDIVIYNEHHEPDSVNYLSVQMIALNALINQSKIINDMNSRCTMLEAIVANQNTLIKDLDERIRVMNKEQ